MADIKAEAMASLHKLVCRAEVAPFQLLKISLETRLKESNSFLAVT